MTDPAEPSAATETTDSAASMRSDEAAVQVLLRVEAGMPTAEELAALVAVLAVRRGPPPDVALPAARRSDWAAHSRRLRYIHRHGPGGWRARAWPG